MTQLWNSALPLVSRCYVYNQEILTFKIFKNESHEKVAYEYQLQNNEFYENINHLASKSSV